MPNLQHRQQKIQEKRKHTPFREFVKEICSWTPLSYYSDEGVISRYPSTERIGWVIPFEEFSDHNEQRYNTGFDDNEGSFFENFRKLFLSMDHPHMIQLAGNENARYADVAYGVRNAYLSTILVRDIDSVAYAISVKEWCSNVYNSFIVRQQCENIYQCVGIIRSSNTFYSKYIVDGYELRWCTNMIGCRECIDCDGLENVSYYIANVAYEKGEYYKLKEKLIQQKDRYFNKYLELSKQGSNYGSVDVEWSFVQQSQRCEYAYLSYQLEDCRNVIWIGGKGINSNFWDVFSAGSISNDHLYGVANAGGGISHLYCSVSILWWNNNFYCYFTNYCSYCLGCIGLENKSYCIFNQQYEKKERYEKVDEIFTAMEKEWTLGDFFSGQTNPFYFNDTAAYLIDDSFTKEEVEAEWYLRRDEEVKVDIPEGVEIVKVSELGEYERWKNSPRPSGTPLKEGGTPSTRHIDPEILNKVIQDEQWNVYRIVKMEYDFLMKYGLPLPRLHWLDRLKMNFRIN